MVFNWYAIACCDTDKEISHEALFLDTNISSVYLNSGGKIICTNNWQLISKSCTVQWYSMIIVSISYVYLWKSNFYTKICY